MDNHGLADACAAEQSDLSTAHERAQQIDDLDAGLQHFGLGVEVGNRWSGAMDRRSVGGVHRSAFIHGLAEEVEHASEHAFAHGHAHWRTSVDARGTAAQAVGGRQCDAANHAAAKVLGNLADQYLLLAVEFKLHGQCVEDLGNPVLRELCVESRTDDLLDRASAGHVCGGSVWSRAADRSVRSAAPRHPTLEFMHGPRSREGCEGAGMIQRTARE